MTAHSCAELDVRAVIAADLRRYGGAFWPTFRSQPGFRFSVLRRINVASRMRQGVRWRGVRFVTSALLWPLRRRYDIPSLVSIGPGLYLSPHPGPIVINGRAVLGADCHLNHGVTIGESVRGRRIGAPVLHDSVYVGAGAVILGAITIGSGAAIGANCVVTTDVAPFAVLATPRPVVISHAGSVGCVTRPSLGCDN